jgi:hypothetical protein
MKPKFNRNQTIFKILFLYLKYNDLVEKTDPYYTGITYSMIYTGFHEIREELKKNIYLFLP